METAKRAAVIESSVQVVANCGFHGASIDLIAGAAGVAAGTVYVHFEGKDHLMAETYRVLEHRCLAAVLKEFPWQGSIRQRFCHLAHGLIRHFMLCPEEFLFADQFLSSPYRKSVSPHYLPDGEVEGILHFFREGEAQQVFKKMPAAMLLAIACGPLIQVVRANAAGFLYLDEDRISRTVDACWEAVTLCETPYLRRRQEGAREPGRQPQEHC